MTKGIIRGKEGYCCFRFVSCDPLVRLSVPANKQLVPSIWDVCWRSLLIMINVVETTNITMRRNQLPLLISTFFDVLPELGRSRKQQVQHVNDALRFFLGSERLNIHV